MQADTTTKKHTRKDRQGPTDTQTCFAFVAGICCWWTKGGWTGGGVCLCVCMCVCVCVCTIVCICFHFSADEIAEDTESFKRSTCSAAPLATSMRMAIANAGLASHELALNLDSLLSLPQRVLQHLI